MEKIVVIELESFGRLKMCSMDYQVILFTLLSMYIIAITYHMPPCVK